jgi:hypothetical protein
MEAHGKWRYAGANVTNDIGRDEHQIQPCGSQVPLWPCPQATLVYFIKYLHQGSRRCGPGYLAPSQQVFQLDVSCITSLGCLCIKKHHLDAPSITDSLPKHHMSFNVAGPLSKFGNLGCRKATLNSSKVMGHVFSAIMQTLEFANSKIAVYPLHTQVRPAPTDLPTGSTCAIVGKQCCFYKNKVEIVCNL